MSSPSGSTSNNMFLVHTINNTSFQPVQDPRRIKANTVNYYPSHFQLTKEEFERLLKHPVVAKNLKRIGCSEIHRNLGPVTWIVKHGTLIREVLRFVIPIISDPKIICYWPSDFVQDNVPEPISVQDPRPPRVSPNQKRPSPSMNIVERDVIVLDDDDEEEIAPPPKKMFHVVDVMEENQVLKEQVSMLQEKLLEKTSELEEFKTATEKRFEKMEQRLVREIECFHRDLTDVRSEFKADIAHINRTAVFREIAKPVPVVAATTGKAQKKTQKKKK